MADSTRPSRGVAVFVPVAIDELATLRYALSELTGVVAALDDWQTDTVTNSAPWTVRQLASHAVNNQLLWAGMVTGKDLVSAEVTMGAVAYDGDLAPFADDAARQALSLWGTEGVLEGIHATPLAAAGSTVIYFAIVDAVAHSWDLSAVSGTRSSSRPRRSRPSPQSWKRRVPMRPERSV